MRRFSRPLAAYLVAGTLLFFSGWFVHAAYLRHTAGQPERRVVIKGYRFTSPLLDVELPEGMTIGDEPIPFFYKVKAFVEEQKKAGRVQNIAIYYRDLHDGPWFGINEATEFNAASMMKVPVMIAWLKRAETDPGVLKRKLTFKGYKDMTALQHLSPEHAISVGGTYSVDELLDRMMRYSDNNATSLLYFALDASELNSVLDGMDVTNDPLGDANLITVHGYSGFFRILYNASFLNREMSEKALELMSQEDFPQGFVAGLPPGTIIASKFGEHAEGPGDEDRQLHEFGIIYHPKAPYILGVMTRGHDFREQADVLKEVSHLVYSEVEEHTRAQRKQ